MHSIACACEIAHAQWGVAPRPGWFLARTRERHACSEGTCSTAISLEHALPTYMSYGQATHPHMHLQGNGWRPSWLRGYGIPGNTRCPLMVTSAPPLGCPATRASQKFEMNAVGHGGMATARTSPHGCPWTAQLTSRWARHRPEGCTQCGYATGWLTCPRRVLNRTIARGCAPEQNGSMGVGAGLNTALVAMSSPPYHLHLDRRRQFEFGGENSMCGSRSHFDGGVTNSSNLKLAGRISYAAAVPILNGV